MKYTRLSKEQLEDLQQEFINFLASQTITAKEWETIKKDTPQVAEQELDVFSDLIWEGALTRAEYLENTSADQLFLFKLGSTTFNLIHVKASRGLVDLTSVAGRSWLLKNVLHKDVQITIGSKQVPENRNKAVFGLIQQGAQITTADLYTNLEHVITLNK